MDQQKFSDGELIAGTRKRLGITQTKLAKRAGVSQKLISAIETGVNPMVEPSRSRIWNALRDLEMERADAASRADELARAVGPARSGFQPSSTSASEIAVSISGLLDLSKAAWEVIKAHAIVVKRYAQLEEISRAQDRLIEEQKKMIALYEQEFAKQPELMRHWANEIKLRKESESSFRKEIAELQTSLAVVPETVDARQENIDREQGE